MLSRVERVAPEFGKAFLGSTAKTLQSFASSRGPSSGGVPNTFGHETSLLEVTLIDLTGGETLVTSVLSAYRSATMCIRDDELQLVGVSRVLGAVLLYKLDLNSPQQWRQQVVTNVPTHIMNDESVNVVSLSGANDRVTLLLGYWPYPNNWPHPDLDDNPIPQPVIIEVPNNDCGSLSPLPSRIIRYPKQGMESTLKTLSLGTENDKGRNFSLHDHHTMSSKEQLSIELAIVAHTFQTGDERINDPDMWRKLASKLPNISTSMRPTNYRLPDECRVKHSFPWVASVLANGRYVPYANGSVDGFRFESIRTRMRTVIEGTASPLWKQWW